MPLFFHNRHDRTSWEALALIPEGTQVIDVFGGDQIPEGYRIPRYPYLIDKKIIPFSPLELTLPGGIVQFKTVYENDADFTEPVTLWISVNGQTPMSEHTVDGILSLEIECEEPQIIRVEIVDDGQGFHPWRGQIEVKGL